MKSAMRKTGKSWRKRIWIYACIIGGFVGLSVGFILFAWAVPLGDFAPVYPLPKLSGAVAPIRPEEQIEKHTCGLHAISSIYRSYGLDPEERHLRARLGVDNRSILYDASTTGCLHPDIYRVMGQDQFDCEPLDLQRADARTVLEAHLDKGCYALTLIKRRETGNMHWVVIAGREGSSLRICDSLKPAIFDEDTKDYLEHRVLSVLLIRSTKTQGQTAVWREHLHGTREMLEAFRRRK